MRSGAYRTSELRFPLVSIVMPSKNSESTLRQAIGSVLAQDYREFELLVIDDGSTDGSKEIAADIARRDERVRLFSTGGGRGGVSSARNVGLTSARGTLIGFLDADDEWFPWSLRERVQLMQETGARIVYGPYLRLIANDRVTLIKPAGRVTYRHLLRRNEIGNLTGLYDAEALGIELQKGIPHEDYLMWCRLIERAGWAASTNGRPLGLYRVSSSSLSGNKKRAFKWHWDVLRYHLRLPLVKAIAYQTFYAVSSLTRRGSELFAARGASQR